MLSFFPRGVLGEILNLIESVSESFPSFSYTHTVIRFHRFFSNLLSSYGMDKIFCIQNRHKNNQKDIILIEKDGK